MNIAILKNSFLLLPFSFLFLYSCQNRETKSDEKKSNEKTVAENEKKPQYVLLKPCSFSVKLPLDFEIGKMYEDEDVSADYCDYEIKSPKIFVSFNLSSQLKSRFPTTEIDSLYLMGLESMGKEITRKEKKDNYFILSGKETDGRYFYWKRVVGENFIGDIVVIYMKKNKAEAEKYLEEIGKSFECD